MNTKLTTVILCSLLITATWAAADEYSFEQFLFKDHSVWSGGAVAISAGATISNAIGAAGAVSVGAWAETARITSSAAVDVAAYANTGDLVAGAAAATGQGDRKTRDTWPS